MIVPAAENEAPGPRSKQLGLFSSLPDPISFMELDIADFDSWSFDQISAASPFSPICNFADLPDNKSAGTVAGAAGFRFSSDSRDPEAATGHHKDDDDKDDKKPFPSRNLGSTSLEVPDMYIIKERMTQALRHFMDSTEHSQCQVLAQVWAPIKSGNRYALITSGQPFVLSPHSNGLHHYRTVSQMYSFSLDGDTDESLGLISRVFRQRLPEWTPDVQYYSNKEYQRIAHAKSYNVHGTLALPVFEPSGQSCVGVIELIMTSQKINYAPDVDKVCKALEAVNLRSSDILDQPNIQICNEGRQYALAEILEVFTEVCETYKLPLAQTWVPCRHRSVIAYGGGLKKSCSSFDGSCMDQVCMSTTDVAFYVVDAHLWRFREACAEHHLQKGQGVAGRAFSSQGSCFCEDITRFSKKEYPLVHYAKMFGLASSFAICLRSIYTGEDEYVLEFFLPASLTDSIEEQKLLDSILATMKQHLRSLMVASGRVLEEQRKFMEVVDLSINENHESDVKPVFASHSSELPHTLESLNGGVMPSLETCENLEEKDVTNERETAAGGNFSDVSASKDKETKKPSQRKRGKAEKQISLEVIQQYFAGSLKDAARSLGVCPTTMKRICRQHGISRWPSRKINKVNRSLSKLKRVIESVQGTDATFSLTSLSPNSIPVVGSTSWPSDFNGARQQILPSSNPFELIHEKAELQASTIPGREWQSELANQEISGRTSSQEDHIGNQNSFPRGFEAYQARAGSGSGEASSGTSTSHGSSQDSPANESTPPNSRFVSSFQEQMGNSMGFMFQPTREMGLSGSFSFPDLLLEAQAREPLARLLVDDSANVEIGIPEISWGNPPSSSDHHTPTPRFGSSQEVRSVTIKATFRDDIIRFRFSLSSNIVDLRDEIAKRLKMEVATFEIKYLDDDNEWVLIACDSDLQECLDIIKSSGSSIIRLSIHDLLGILGSSCESSGE
ncbi:hypothetical protein V2J09_020180 [Rumex salicifolius]